MHKPGSLIPHLDALYRDSFKAHTPVSAANFLAWQKKKRVALKKLLEVPKVTIVSATTERAFSVKEGVISVLQCRMSDETTMRLYIGRPMRGSPKPQAIIVYHGHSDGAQTLFGIGMTKPHQNYALPFLRKGYVVVAPDQRGFGERLGPSPVHFRGYTRSCRQLSLDLVLMGRTLVGERVGDGMALVSFVQKMRDVDSSRIIVTGNSGGGTTSLFHAALDTRVDAGMVSGAFCEYKHSIMELSHCECNYIPGILSVMREIDEIGALIAPRPLLIIHGSKDQIFPASSTKKAFARLREMYRVVKADKNTLQLSIQNGGHRYFHNDVFSFLKNFGA